MNKILDLTDLYKKQRNILYILFGILLSCSLLSLIYFTGGTHLGTAGIMYIPILFMVKRFHIIGGLVSGVIFGLILWLVIPLDTRFGNLPELSTSIIRLMLFTTFGIVSGFFFKINDRRSSSSKLILSKMDDAFCFVNHKSVIQYYNNAFKEYLRDILLVKGLDDVDIKKLTINDLLEQSEFDDNDNDFKYIYEAVLQGKRISNHPIKVTFKDEEFILNHRIEPVVWEHKNYGSLVSIKDYKAKHEYEKNIKTFRYTDEITGLRNKKYFDHHISNLPIESYPQGIVIFDFDTSKFVNESFGYKQSEELLKATSQIISKVSNNYGVCARYEDNEFIICIPEATPKVIDAMVSKVNKHIEGLKIKYSGVSLSSGYHIRESLLDSVFNTIKLAKQNLHLLKNIKSNQFSDNSVNIIMGTLHEKDAYSETHSQSVSYYTRLIAIACGLPGNQVTEITSAALLHDIGKIIVPDEILQKKSQLTELEYEKIKQHSEIGFRLLKKIDGMKSVSNIILSHHERWDGNGYPAGKKGEDIPLGSRIISIADTFDAIVTDRAYRKKKDKIEALTEIKRCSGTQFDPHLIDIFVKNFDNIIQI